MPLSAGVEVIIFVSSLFNYMIPIDCKITNFSLYLLFYVHNYNYSSLVKIFIQCCNLNFSIYVATPVAG